MRNLFAIDEINHMLDGLCQKEAFFLVMLGIVIVCLTLVLIKLSLSSKKNANKLIKARNDLIEAYDRLQGIIESSSDLIAAIDLNHRFMAFNSEYKQEVEKLFHVPVEMGMPFDVLTKRMDPENREKVERLWEKALSGQSFTIIESFKDSRFSTLIYEIHYNPIRNSKGELIGASHIATNVFERIQYETKLAESKKKLEIMVKNLEQQNKELELLKELTGLLLTSTSFEDAIDAFYSYIKRMMKHTSGAIYLVAKDNKHQLKQVLHWGEPLALDDTFKIHECLALTCHRPYYVVNTKISVLCKHVKTQTEKPANYICLPLYAQNVVLGLLYIECMTNERMIALAHIISEQVSLSLYNIKLRDDLKIQSTQDALTGLYNRRFFEEYVHKEIQKSRRTPSTFAILLIDIDCFKAINDTYGHLMGDKVLQEVAKQLRLHCRDYDLVARWGGEEFAICLRDITQTHVKKRADNIRCAIESLHVVFHHVKLHTMLTISIGIALFPEHGDNIDQLISLADKALYSAKHMGKNTVILYGEA